MNKEELKIGMYVRTKNKTLMPSQIAKIINMVKDSGYKDQYYIEIDKNLIPSYEFHIYQADILKASFNIIDLIEVKDVIEINITDKDNYPYILGINFIRIENERDLSNIKDMISNESAKLMQIVTHEQMEQMSYKLNYLIMS